MSTQKQPHEYSRRVLLAVTGLSPQVVTETLYALAVAKEQPFVPTEIHIITTQDGAQQAEKSLFSSEYNWFNRLVNDYDLPPIRFSSDNIHVLFHPDGQPLEDIRSVDHNTIAADLITEKMRELTADPDSALHVSIAGGRKTMGFYLGYALSLYGRAQDRLSHVLVSSPFENTWAFFYPTPYSHVIELRDGKLVDSQDATVTLAEIPFVSLRHEIPTQLLEGRSSYSQTVNAAKTSLTPPRLIIDLEGRRIKAGDCVINLQPRALALLSLFARRVKNNEPPIGAPYKEVPDEQWSQWYLAEYTQIRNERQNDIENTKRALKNGMTGDDFSTRKSNLHSILKKQLGAAVAQAYYIDDGGSRPRRYTLKLPSTAIEYAEI